MFPRQPADYYRLASNVDFPQGKNTIREIIDPLETILQFNFLVNLMSLSKLGTWLSLDDQILDLKIWARTCCSHLSTATPWGRFNGIVFFPTSKSTLTWGRLFSYPQKWNHLYSFYNYSHTTHPSLRLSSLHFFLPDIASINKWEGDRNNAKIRKIFKEQNV